jgi:hypothetical protein
MDETEPKTPAEKYEAEQAEWEYRRGEVIKPAPEPVKPEPVAVAVPEKGSTHARAAKMIRAELRAAFPGVTFRVRSDSFAGGNSVDVSWTDGPLTDAVNAIVKKYQYGNFNGMEDIYEYSNSRNDIPQAKYVQTHRAMSPETRERIRKDLEAQWGISFENEHSAEVWDRCGTYASTMIHREFSKAG